MSSQLISAGSLLVSLISLFVAITAYRSGGHRVACKAFCFAWEKEDDYHLIVSFHNTGRSSVKVDVLGVEISTFYGNRPRTLHCKSPFSKSQLPHRLEGGDYRYWRVDGNFIVETLPEGPSGGALRDESANLAVKIGRRRKNIRIRNVAKDTPWLERLIEWEADTD